MQHCAGWCGSESESTNAPRARAAARAPGLTYHPSGRGRGAAAPAAMDVTVPAAGAAGAQHWANKGKAERRTDHELATGRSVGGHAAVRGPPPTPPAWTAGSWPLQSFCSCLLVACGPSSESVVEQEQLHYFVAFPVSRSPHNSTSATQTSTIKLIHFSRLLE